MAVAIRDKTAASQQLAVASDGSITASIKGNGSPPARSMDYWTVDQFAPATNAETLLTITESVNGAATGTFTTRVVTSGKTMRINSISLSLEQTGGTPIIMRAYIGIRFNTAGAATASSPLIYRTGLAVAATLKQIANFYAVFPDGMEFVGDGTKQIGISAIVPDYVVTTQLCKISIGLEIFEY